MMLGGRHNAAPEFWRQRWIRRSIPSTVNFFCKPLATSSLNV
jgi:hypothetical protein